MKKIFLPAFCAVIIFAGCNKSEATNTANDFNAKKDAGITDFVNKVAIPGYAELKQKADVLNNSIITLNTNTTDANLTLAKNAWKDMRSTWENEITF